MNGLYLAIKKITPASMAFSVFLPGQSRTPAQAPRLTWSNRSMISETHVDDIAREAVRQTAYTSVRKPLDLEAVLDLLDRLTGQGVSGKIRKPDPNMS